MFSRVRTASMLRRPASALRQQPRCVGLPAASLHSTAARRGATEDRMKELGIELPAYQDAVWSYVKAQRDGDKFYIGDHVGQDENAVTVRGKVGDAGDPLAEVSPDEAEQLSRNAGLRLLSTLSHYLDGELDRVDQVIKVVGIVNGTPDFRGHGKVVNGCSDLLVEVLGERGKHARTCTGSGSLPAAVTCEMVVRVKD
jgi:enamine deaminase RidA (YjgF/YER057c/UK114 family)